MLIKLKSGATIAAGKATEPKYKEVGDKETPLGEFGIAAAKTKDEYGVDKTVWINCKCWRDEAKLAQDSVHKGDVVLILGVTASRSWEGRDGAQRTVEETTVDFLAVQPSFETLDALMQRPGVTVQSAKDPVGSAFAEVDDEDGDLPF
jgi:single-stranded DNA-binding protein